MTATKIVVALAVVLLSIVAAYGPADAQGTFVQDQRFTICLPGTSCTGPTSVTISGVEFVLLYANLPPSGMCVPSAPQNNLSFTLHATNHTYVVKTVATKSASLRTDGIPDWANASSSGALRQIPAGTSVDFNFQSDCNAGNPWGGVFQVNVQPEGSNSQKTGPATRAALRCEWSGGNPAVMQCYSRQGTGDCQWPDSAQGGDPQKKGVFLACYQSSTATSDAAATQACCVQEPGGCYRSAPQYEANRGSMCGH